MNHDRPVPLNVLRDRLPVLGPGAGIRLIFTVGSLVCALAAVLIAARGIYTVETNSYPIYFSRLAKISFVRETYIIFTVCSIASFALFIIGRVWPSPRLAKPVALHADPLSERAGRATRALSEATKLVHELAQELTARSALLEDLKKQYDEASQHVEDMEALAKVDERTTRILNQYFDEALKSRLEELEQAARRREWLIGTLVAFSVAIIAIPIAHFLFGF